VALKMVAQPLVTYLLGRYVFGVGRHTLLAVTVIAALPTAQNVFVIADRYGRGSLLARDVILLTTLVSLPVALAISALLA
jgi:predicted permease